MPYPNPADPELRERMRFMDAAATAVAADMAAQEHTAGDGAAQLLAAADGPQGAENRQLEANRGPVGPGQGGTAWKGPSPARPAVTAGSAGAQRLLCCAEARAY